MRTDGRTDGRIERQTDMTKLVFVFHKFASMPKISLYLSVREENQMYRMSYI